MNRGLRPETDTSRLSRFRDDRWDLNPAIFEDHRGPVSLTFAKVPAELQEATKYYFWQLLNCTEHRKIRGSGRISVQTVYLVLGHALLPVLKRLAEHGLPARARSGVATSRITCRTKRPCTRSSAFSKGPPRGHGPSTSTAIPMATDADMRRDAQRLPADGGGNAVGLLHLGGVLDGGPGADPVQAVF
ncbi:hypothetical protein ACFY2H_36560 [Streptomyces griseofuscus]|uniref:hypothetical protein n=1 Tax=Streptomyces griseofuscus TaxID=146922 RepID=UPI0036B15E84